MAKKLPKWARVRQLIDGSYVAEVRCGIWPLRRWRGVGNSGNHYLYDRRHYGYCIVQTPEEAISILAARGVSLVDDGRSEPKAPDEAPSFLKHSAFITGSHCYGTPLPSSDVDLAVLCSPETEKKLKELSDDKCFPIRFGKLNLVTLKSQDEYDAWLAARARLSNMSAHTKETRVSVHKEELQKRGCVHRKDVSS